MKTTFRTIAIIVFLFGSFNFSHGQQVDLEESQLVWNATKAVGSHTGEVSLLAGTLNVEDQQIISGEFIIDMTSITCTDIKNKEMNQRLVNHLRSDDFFDVSNHRVSTLRITDSEPFDAEGNASINGELTIRGTTHPVTFPVIKKDGNYTTTIEVDRTKYDIRYGSGSFFDNLGDDMIHDIFTMEVTIVIK
jgi:polyisoprenoid-binding protein YceI